MRRQEAHPARTAWLVIGGLVAFMLVLAGCGGSSDSSSSGGDSNELQKLGKGEGQLNLISWAGYVEPEWTAPPGENTFRPCTVVSHSFVFTSVIGRMYITPARLMITSRRPNSATMASAVVWT